MIPVYLRELGTVGYQQAWDYQEQLFKATVEQKASNRDLPQHEQVITDNYLIFCEHPDVITLGKSGKADNLLLSDENLKEFGIEFYRINRGGDITFHGPGQIVGYPILDLDHFFTDIHKYLRLLEEMVILTLAEYGLKGERLKGATGVWLDADLPGRQRKICALGIRCSRWVTMHGFALNVNTNLERFSFIVPCGIQDKAVTSLAKELGHEVPIAEVKDKLKLHFSELFRAELIGSIKPPPQS
ncbi:MAG: lipoyl(octanoyl) transferase LipB [Chitinophagales bacterium]|nr:lipoyl(octanoyl) transferase LipB [Chitinophagales bacterium]